MISSNSKTYVLVHGGWHGGWCWVEVAQRLMASGHRVFTPTMTGLGERSHLVRAVEGPETHVTDIVNTLLWNELTEVILVGHSYGGMIISGVASQLPDRVAHLVYIDAFVPESGQSAVDMALPELKAKRANAVLPDGTIEPDLFHQWSENPEKIEWLKQLTMPHPANCFTQGVELTGRESDVRNRTYILAGKNRPSHFEPFYERFKTDPKWQVHVLPCLHDVMVELPNELSGILLKADS